MLEEENIGKGLYEQIKNSEKLGIQYPLTKEKFIEILKEQIFKDYIEFKEEKKK